MAVGRFSNRRIARFEIQHRRIAKIKGVLEHFCIEVATNISRAMEVGNVSKVLQAVLPVFLLAVGAIIPAAVQSFVYLCCLIFHFKTLVWSNVSQHSANTARSCVGLWTVLLAFSFSFLTMEIIAQVFVNVELKGVPKETMAAVLRILGLYNLTATRLVLALAKHFLVLFVSSWQRGLFLGVLDEDASLHRFSDLVEIKKSSIKFAEIVAIHSWPLVLLSLCLIKVTPLNLPYVTYLTAYSFYTGSRPYGDSKRGAIKGIKIGYLMYSSLHFTFLLFVRVGAQLSPEVAKLAKQMRLSFLCDDGLLAITTIYIGCLVLSLVLGLFEFGIEKYPESGEGLQESLLPKEASEGASEGESAGQGEVAAPADPYHFHWCTGLLFSLYSLLLARMTGFVVLAIGLLIMIMPRERGSLCKKLILVSAYYMSFLWLAVYLIVSSSTCSGYLRGLGLCDGRMNHENRFFETHLLSALPIISILVMKQNRMYHSRKSNKDWIVVAYDRTNGCMQYLLGSVSPVLVPCTWAYLATFCQPDNDVLHSVYILALVLHLVFRLNVVKATRVFAAFHIVVVFLTKELFYGKSLLNYQCKEGSTTAIINSCILSESKYRQDMLLMLFLVLSTSLDEKVVIESGRRLSTYSLFQPTFETFKKRWEVSKKAFVHVYGTTLGWYLTLLFIILLVHLENLKGMRNSLIQVLWTSVCVLNLVFSNFSESMSDNSKLRSAIPIGAMIHLLVQFVYASFYLPISKELPSSNKTTAFIEDNIGLARDTTAWHLIVSVGEPVTIMLLAQLYTYCCTARERSVHSLDSAVFKFVKRLAVVHLDKLLAFVVFLFAVNLNTILGTMILFCYLISLHLQPSGYRALRLLKSCEILTCLTLVAAEALYVPCISKSVDHRTRKLINFICCANQRDYFITSWLSLTVLSLSKITIQYRKSKTLNEFVTSWPTALSSSPEKAQITNGGAIQSKDPIERKKEELALKWLRLKSQFWYLKEVSPFYIERLFSNHGSGLCSFIFLLCAFYAKNLISIVYVSFILLSMKKMETRGWIAISIACTMIALYQDILAILESHEVLIIRGISKEWIYWFSLNPDKHLIWTFLIAAFFSSLKFRYSRFGESKSDDKKSESQSSVKFFDHYLWSGISYSERKNWTSLEYLLYGFFRYSQDISLVFVVSLAFYDKDAIHLGYLFLSLYFFRQREALRRRRNRDWRILVGFNLTIIALNIVYQSPAFHSTSKENTCNIQNLIGLYKITGLIGNSIHLISMRPITSILLFLVLQIQAFIFMGKTHVAVTQCGLDFREHKQHQTIKLQHQQMLTKKFEAQEAFRSNESRKQRLRWLRNNILKTEPEAKDKGVPAITSGIPEEGTNAGLEADGKSGESQENSPNKTTHTRSRSDLPEQMFLPSIPTTRPSNNSTTSAAEEPEPSNAEQGAGIVEKPTVAEKVQNGEISESSGDQDDSKHGGDEVEESSKELTELTSEILTMTFWQKLFVSNRADSHNFFCYFCMCFFFISEFSILSMAYPIVIFYYTLLVKSPPKKFWKAALASMEFWLLAQYIWQIPIYNSGISSDNVSICEWVSEKAAMETLKIIGLHESAARCFPGFILYLSCLFHFFSLESKIEEQGRENLDGEGKFTISLLIRKIKLFYLQLTTYHEEFPSFVHIKVKGETASLEKLSNVELGVALTVFLQDKLTRLSYTTCTPHMKVLERETQEASDVAVILAVVDTSFDINSNDGLLIHPGRTIAKLIRGCSGEMLFKPWESAVKASSDKDAPKLTKSDVTVEDAFAAHEDKPDLYVYTVWMDIFAYIFVLCLYQVAVSSNRSLSESLNESIFPADYIITIFGLFLFLLADRAVYVLASNKLRMFLHYLLIPAYFTGGMLMYWQRAPDHPSYTCIFMFVKCFSLAMQSWQLQTGYPKSTSGNLLLRHYNMGSWLAETTYSAIPFLYELRSLLDWSCTGTTLTLFDWLTFEEIRATLFRAEMVKQFKSRRKFGHSQPKHVKFFQGILLFILLLIILWTPLLVFSSGSPSFQVPILKGVDMNVTLLTGDLKIKNPWERPDQRMPLFSGGNNRIIAEASYSPPLISKYFYYQQIQCLAVAPEANQLWLASRPSKQSLAGDILRDDKRAFISVSWSMIRDHPVSASMCASTIFAEIDSETRKGLSQALNMSVPMNTTDVRIPLKLKDPRTREEVPGLYRLYWQLNGSPCTVIDRVTILKGKDPWVDCDLVLHTQIDKEGGYAFKSQWWDMECNLPEEATNKTDPCWQKGKKSARGKNGPLLKAILQEVQSGVIGTFLSSKGITGLYITFVFLIGRGVRGMVSHRILQIPLMELPSIQKLKTLCDDIRDARTVFDLELEELLYNALIRIYRSSELLYEMTRKVD